jgi:ubiquitin carboxyl-terminal hydrolase 25/28
MDIGEAYKRLGIYDRTIDDDLILTTFDIRTQENPLDLQNLRAALKAIGREKNSTAIENFLATGTTTDQYDPAWPVGLDNIGNTCYLNSLLQFYYTVKPLRELVYNIDNYLAEQIGPRKQVGGRKVSREEVERAQRCKRSR